MSDEKDEKEQARRIRMAVSLNELTESRLKRYSQYVVGDRPASVAFQILSSVLQELDEKGDIPEGLEPVMVERTDLNQIREYLKLLSGTRESRQGVSFAVVGKVLGMTPEELNDLYNLVCECREGAMHG